jgi:hypothetical protein
MTGGPADRLVAGSATVDITPDWPVMLGGFGQRTEPAEVAHDPVEATGLWLSHGAGHLLLIAADLIAMPGPVADEVAARIADATGVDPASICLTATHTHSAPVPFDPSGTAVGVGRFQAMLVERLVECGVAAVGAARPSQLSTAIGRAGFLYNRCTRGAAGSTDDRVVVAVIDDASTGRPVSVLFGVGCHPVTLGWDSNEISADYPGLARRLLRTRLGVRHALFVNGTEGDVIPRTSPNLDSLDPRGYAGGSWDDTLGIAGELADAVVAAVAEARRFDDMPQSVGAARTELRCEVNTGGIAAPDVAGLLADATRTLRSVMGDAVDTVPPGRMWAAASQAVIEHDLPEEEMRALMIACCRFLGLSARAARATGAPPAAVPVQALRIGDLAMLAVPGEALTEVGEAWRARVGNDSHGFVVSLANGHLRYLPRAASFARPDAATRYETVTAGLAPDGVERILDAGVELLVSIR